MTTNRASLAAMRHLAVAEPFPFVGVPRVAGVAGVHADDEAELLHPLPERVELGQRERLAALPRGHRRHADQEDLGAALGHVLELARAPTSLPAARLMIGVEKIASEYA